MSVSSAALTNVRDLARQFAPWFLPYPDPRRRARFRRAAHRLVTCDPWPGDAATGTDAAELALRRLLFLQVQTRRAAWLRQSEAAALLARSAAETCIVGLYCLHHDDAPKALDAADWAHGMKLIAFLVADGVIPQQLLEDAAQQLAMPGAKLPSISRMAELIPDSSHKTSARFVYDRYYGPLSHYFAHASAYTLMRTVRARDRVARNPQSPWPRRSAAHLTDACAAVLAAAIAEQSGSGESFRRYAHPHAKRTLPPVLGAVGAGILHGLNWHQIPQAARAVRETRAYLAPGGPAEADSRDVRENRVRATMEAVYKALRIYADNPQMFGPTVDHFVGQVLDEYDARYSTSERLPDGAPPV